MLLHSLVNLLGAQCQCWIRYLKLWGHSRQLLVEGLRGLLLLEIYVLSHHGDILLHFECSWVNFFLLMLVGTDFFAILGLIWLIRALMLRLYLLIYMLHGSNGVHSSWLAHMHEVFRVHRIIVELLLLLLLKLHLLVEVGCKIWWSTTTLIIHLIHGFIWKLGLHGRREGLHGGGRIRVWLVLADTPINSVVVKHVLAESLVG